MIKRYGFWQLLLTLLLIFYSCMSCFAEDGTGEGGGQNQDEPLTLVSCNIKDGEKGVSVGAAIDLEFSKNVVNMTVAGNNKKCISLTDRDGNTVPIEIRMGDDQVDPTIKRLVTIVPKEPFAPECVYTLTISGGFQSKSGTTLGTPIIISFQTVGNDIDSESKSETEGAGIEPATQGVTSDAGLVKDPADNSPATSEGTSASQIPAGKRMNPWIVFSACCLIAGAVLLVIYMIRRIKK